MAKRKVITIDQVKCNGCGKCVDACAEGAIEMIDGKAVLVADLLCDGFGDCLGSCPTDALVIEERDVDDFDADAVRQRVAEIRGQEGVERFAQAHRRHDAAEGASAPMQGGCPGLRERTMPKGDEATEEAATGSVASRLGNWPIQLHLISPAAPALREADLLIAADCTAFALGAFHSALLRDRALIIACPKLDDTSSYVDKIAQIIADNNLASLTVARMEVPCCSGLTQLVTRAREASGVSLPIREIILGIDNGEILSRAVV